MPAAYLKASSGPMAPVFCGKIAYDNRRAAHHARNSMRQGTAQVQAHGAGRLGVYRCPACQRWHVGHNQGNMRRKKR